LLARERKNNTVGIENHILLAKTFREGNSAEGGGRLKGMGTKEKGGFGPAERSWEKKRNNRSRNWRSSYFSPGGKELQEKVCRGNLPKRPLPLGCPKDVRAQAKASFAAPWSSLLSRGKRREKGLREKKAR